MTQKSCTTCTFGVAMNGFVVNGDPVSISYCYHKQAAIKLPSGEKVPTMCEDMRKDGAKCGPEGKLFAEYTPLPLIILPARMTTVAAKRDRIDHQTLTPKARTGTGKGAAPYNRSRVGKSRPAPYKEKT